MIEDVRRLIISLTENELKEELDYTQKDNKDDVEYYISTITTMCNQIGCKNVYINEDDIKTVLSNCDNECILSELYRYYMKTDTDDIDDPYTFSCLFECFASDISKNKGANQCKI